jgi:acyl-CoA oxidase
MGYRMGLNGVDNAKLLFDNVRVPRENLLNKYSDVDDSGKFMTSIANGRARFLTVADQVYKGLLLLFCAGKDISGHMNSTIKLFASTHVM